MVDFLVIGSANSSLFLNMHRLFIEDRVCVGYGVVTDFNNSEKKVLSYWYSSFEIEKDPIELSMSYDEKIHKKYLNYDAINIDNIREMPKDYDGVMGVPITFLERWCRRQFEIVDARDYRKDDSTIDMDVELLSSNRFISSVDGEPRYVRILIKRKIS